LTDAAAAARILGLALSAQAGAAPEQPASVQPAEPVSERYRTAAA
jgi:hypothetical protein